MTKIIFVIAHNKHYMNRLLLLVAFFVTMLTTQTTYAQLPHCCKKKVRIRKQSRRARGVLVGVKGKDDTKSFRKRERERAKAFKAAERKKRLDEKNKAKDSISNIAEKKPVKPKTDSERVDDLLKIFEEEEKNLDDD